MNDGGCVSGMEQAPLSESNDWNYGVSNVHAFLTFLANAENAST